MHGMRTGISGTDAMPFASATAPRACVLLLKTLCRVAAFLAVAVLLVHLSPAHAQDSSPSTLTTSFNTTVNGDFTASGVGLRGATSGNITIAGIPSGGSVVRAFLYWAMLDDGEDASLPELNLNGSAIVGSLIGSGPDTCWGRTNSFTFRADVTALVTGNGVYALTGVASGGNILAEGASLVVVYQLAGAPLKTILLDDGNVSLPLGTKSGSAAFSGFTATAPVTATTSFIVGDGQEADFGPTPTSFTGSAGTINFPGLFASLEGPLWDTDTFDVSSVVGAGSATASAQITYADDCLLWSAQVFSVTVSSAATTQTITQPLSPTAPNTFNFGPHNFTVQYPPGTSFSGVNMSVVAAQTPEAAFQELVAGTPFAKSVCTVYTGEGGNCIKYSVTCSNTNGGVITCPSTPTPSINVKTSYDTTQTTVNPGFLTAPIGSNQWQNIFTAYYAQRIDPTTKGRTIGFSQFFTVDLGATNLQGEGTLQFLDPLRPTDPRVFSLGKEIPVEFQLASIAKPGTLITDATASLSLVMVADANGNPTMNPVLQQSNAFLLMTGGTYAYPLSTMGYAAGVYVLTVYGNAFPVQHVQFTLAGFTQ